MASAKEIFNSKIDIPNLTGSSGFFNNLDEINIFNKKQDRFISSIDYSKLSQFIKFGSAEEYYKNAIIYINDDYRFDAATAEKLEWENSLNDFEYHLFQNEYPRSDGFINLSGSQYIDVHSHIKELDKNAKGSYDFKIKNLLNNKINFLNGITFECWLNFDTDLQNSQILQIQAISASSGVTSSVPLFTLYRSGSSNTKFVIKDNLSLTNYTFSSEIQKNSWHHYAFTIKNDTAKLYVDGQLTEVLQHNITATAESYVFSPCGLLYESILDENLELDTSNKKSVFKIGGNAKFSIDELRFWNKERDLEKIGRFWFTNINGNDFSDELNCNLLFYYKFNEGWDLFPDICLDYSGRQNDSLIKLFSNDCRSTGSAINLSKLVQDIEEKDIIVNGLSFSSAVKQFYQEKISAGIEHDYKNNHMLYKKFPSWILEEEDTNETKHLKQLIQIISCYFDDLYVKVTEINKYKHVKYQSDKQKIYPFYDKIITSAGFDVTDLFSNLNILEKISSRNDETLFDEDIKKIKNSIFQNIYNNISYIFKSKGTKKSLKSFLRSYGVNEDLVKINLYADNNDFYVKNRTTEKIIKKKSILLRGKQSIFLSSANCFEETLDNNYFTLETAVSFPPSLETSNYITSSIFGFHNSNLPYDLNPLSANTNYYFYVTLEKDLEKGYRIAFSDGTNTVRSDFYTSFYDDSIWSFCIRKKPNIDTVHGADISSISYNLELYAVNDNRSSPIELSCSIPYTPTEGYIRHFIGSRNAPYDDIAYLNPANSKFYYCNFWTDYLDNDIIKSHNRDILNYGVNE